MAFPKAGEQRERREGGTKMEASFITTNVESGIASLLPCAVGHSGNGGGICTRV